LSSLCRIINPEIQYKQTNVEVTEDKKKHQTRKIELFYPKEKRRLSSYRTQFEYGLFERA